MANKKQPVEAQTSIDNLNDTLTNVSRKVEDNRKIIYTAALAVVVVVAIILIYLYLVRQPGIQKSNDAVGQADVQLALGNDSVALSRYMMVADDHSYDAANRAALQAAILLYKDGKYEDALKYVEKYDPTESIVGAAAYSLEGDCYVNLDKLSDAVGAYKKAISQSDDNKAYTPFFMLKLARVYRAQNDYAAEAKIYEDITKNYPQYGAMNNINIEKYLERAKIDAAK